MSAAAYDITIEQGADYALPLVFQDGTGTAIDISAATFRSQIRASADSGVILASFTTTIDGTTMGRLVLSLTAEQTAAMNFTTPAVYDLFMVNAGVTYRMVAGNVTLTPTVTR